MPDARRSASAVLPRFEQVRRTSARAPPRARRRRGARTARSRPSSTPGTCCPGRWCRGPPRSPRPARSRCPREASVATLIRVAARVGRSTAATPRKPTGRTPRVRHRRPEARPRRSRRRATASWCGRSRPPAAVPATLGGAADRGGWALPRSRRVPTSRLPLMPARPRRPRGTPSARCSTSAARSPATRCCAVAAVPLDELPDLVALAHRVRLDVLRCRRSSSRA